MSNYLLDTTAIIALRSDEEGADQVETLLRKAIEGQVNIFACFISTLELMYRVWRDEGKAAAYLAVEQYRQFPLKIVVSNDELIEIAAKIKATNRLSLAYALIAAAAIQKQAVLVHKDPEFEQLDLEQMKLPYKKRQHL